MIIWHMWKLADKIEIRLKHPFCLLDYLDQRPPGMHWKRYLQTLEELQRLESLRMLFSTYSIFGGGFPLSAGFIKEWVKDDSREGIPREMLPPMLPLVHIEFSNDGEKKDFYIY